MARPPRDSKFHHVHAHSQYSCLDALSGVNAMVAEADAMGQPGIGLTDHGNMGGIVKLYLACMERGLLPWPGVEGYLIDPTRDDWAKPPKGAPVQRYHFGLLARTEAGYKALVRFVSMTHTRPRFSRFPRATIGDLMDLGKAHGDDLILTTGCYFGLIQSMVVRGRTDVALRYLNLLHSVFPHTFVEVQHHNICHDDQPDDDPDVLNNMDDDVIVATMFELADLTGLSVVATQDSHYLKPEHKAAHSLMKRMTYGGSEDEFPGDSFHLADAAWVAAHYDQDQWDRIEDGFEHLLDLNDVNITPLNKFRPRIPHLVDDPEGHVLDVVEPALDKHLGEQGIAGEAADTYWDRLEKELTVVNKLKMSTYFAIVEDYVRACRERGIAVEARGSANGSLTTFLMAITQTDPVHWGGMFERFLSEDRIKPPDIDLDIEDSERGWLLRYLLGKYDAVQIGTYSQLGTYIDPDTGEEKGSVLQTWFQAKRRECEQVALQRAEAGKISKGDVKRYAQGIFQRTYGDVKEVDDVKRHSEKDWEGLRQLIGMKTAYKSYGTHAGGILLGTDDIPIDDWIPTMLVASSDTRVTQYDMDDVEQFGLLKMDILGQSSLRVMKTCQQNMIETGKLDPDHDPTDFSWMPYDDPGACKHLREGRTNTGIFHFEGYTKAKGGKELGIKSTEDAVMAQALYMPGAMDSGEKDKYVARRKSAQARRAITYISPEFEKVLKWTYGTVIFQEQVIDIMRNLGMDIAGINKFFKIVKDSGKGSGERNAARLAEVRSQFEELCRRRGIADVDAAWAQTAGFVSYGFNRAHASGYGIRSYRTAYLKEYAPTEYMAALLQTWAGRDKEKHYIREARRMGIRLLPPDVNVSGMTWTMDITRDNVIRKGLLSVPGIGDKTAVAIADNKPYDDIDDLATRVPNLSGGKSWLEERRMAGSIRALDDVGALDSIK